MPLIRTRRLPPGLSGRRQTDFVEMADNPLLHGRPARPEIHMPESIPNLPKRANLAPLADYNQASFGTLEFVVDKVSHLLQGYICLGEIDL